MGRAMGASPEATCSPGLTMCVGDALMIVGNAVGLVATCLFVYHAKEVPPLPRGKRRKYLAYLRSSVLVLAVFAGMWLLIQRLLDQARTPPVTLGRIVTTIVTLTVMLFTVSIERTARSLAPTWAIAAWTTMFMLSIPRLFAKGQVHNTIDDCLWVIIFSEAFFCVVAVYPRTSLSFKSTYSPLLQMVLFKMVSTDGLRLTSVVVVVSKLLSHGVPGTWSWFGIFLPSWLMDIMAVVCLRWRFFQPRQTSFRPRASSDVDDASAGWLLLCQSLTFWSVTVGFPGGMLFRILWVLNDEAWHWDPSSSIHPRFVTRFLVPFIILPGAVTLLLVPKFRTLLANTEWFTSSSALVLLVGATFLVLSSPVLLFMVKFEAWSACPWVLAALPGLLFGVAIVVVATRTYILCLQNRNAASRPVFRLDAGCVAQLCHAGIQVKEVRRPVVSLLHWLALGDLVQVIGREITACYLAYQLINHESLTWYTFTPLLVGEGVCLLLDAFVLLRTEAIPRLEMLWTLLRYRQKLDDVIAARFFRTSTTSPMEEPLLGDHGAASGDADGDKAGVGSRTPPLPVASRPLNMECAVCLTNTRDVLLRPCRHVPLCFECSQLRSPVSPNSLGSLFASDPYRIAACPICRCPIEERERIFV